MEYKIVRTYSAGVFAGEIESRNGYGYGYGDGYGYGYGGG